ncbi:hypothetical protein GQ43DRAFT_403698 [Delitschia confertaspora ATCC 74209]|uniref:Rhodopsin domain-containing protein n=1 Tax=Delitschia confertaspora ATCC 74209 TaxID=1513339 RepID=A0A9P4MNI3_9PLEO|nr:hypothetical protein GQ43DRAFT_403698 [Delitschia confertaspora ATCC 74209]
MSFHTPTQTPGLQYALAIILSIGPTIFTALRFRARAVKKTPLELDDWLIVVSLIFVHVTATFLIVGTAIGYQGRHMKIGPGGPDITDPKYIWFLKMLYAGQLSQIFAIGPAKISVLLFYRRIFRGVIFNFTTWSLIGLVAAWMTSFFFANLLECLPISQAFVNAPGLGGDPHCINAVPMYLAQVYSDVVLDVLILIVPIPPVWKLQLPTRQKFAVSGIFLLGIITVLASCAKMIIFNYVGHELQKQPDVSYFLSPITYWPLIEASLQIVAACLPILRPLVQDLRLIISSKAIRGKTGYMKSSEGKDMIGPSYSGFETRIYSSKSNEPHDLEMDQLPLHVHSDVRLTTEVRVV